MYKIFIVDDEIIIARGLEKIINWEQLGCRVYLYNSSIQAYEDALVEKPAILITDIRMPFMDGLNLINKLKSSFITFEAIVLSGYSEFEYARKGIDLGVVKYLLKPVVQKELEAAVLKSIARYTQRLEDSVIGAKTTTYPDEEAGDNIDVIDEIKNYITDHYSKNIFLTLLSELFFLNPYYISQLFKKKTGHTYIQYLTNIRIKKARELLTKTNMNVAEVCHRVGYENVRHFSRTFEKIVGVKPSSIRKISTACISKTKDVFMMEINRQNDISPLYREV